MDRAIPVAYPPRGDDGKDAQHSTSAICASYHSGTDDDTHLRFAVRIGGGLAHVIESSFMGNGAIDQNRSRSIARPDAAVNAAALDWETAPVGLVSLDLAGAIRACNSAAARLLRVEPAHVVGRSIFPFVAADDIERFRQQLNRLPATGGSGSCELALAGKRESYVEIHMEAVSNNGDGIGSYRLVMTDVSALRRTERELAQAREALADQMRDTERLHELSMRQDDEADLPALLEEITSVAVDITQADMGNLLLVDETTGELVGRAYSGFDESFRNATRRFHPDSLDSPCTRAIKARRRVIAPNVEGSDLCAASNVRSLLLENGIRALESTPLIARSGRVLGVIATHYRRPTTPDNQALRRLDLLARQAADLIERAKSKADLEASERRLRGFYESSAVLSSIIELRDDDFVYVQPNDRIAAFFGLTADTLAGRSAREVGFPEEKITECLGQFRRCAESREAMTTEYAFEFGGVEQRYFGTISFLCEKGGRPQFCLTLIDVTAQHATEAALRESEYRYRTFVDHAMDVFMLHDKNGIIVDVNQQACESLGYDREELLGMSPGDFDPEANDAGLANIAERLDAGETISFDSIHRRKDGSTYPVEVRIRPFWVEGRRFSVSLARDITGRKQSEEALKQSEARFRGALENIPDVIAIYDADLRIQYINAAARRVTGRDAPYFLGHRSDEIWPPNVYEKYLPTLCRARDTRMVQSIDTEIQFDDGPPRSLQITCVPLLNDDGTIREILGITRDFTERKRAEHAIRESEQRFSQFMEHLPGLAWIKDSHGRYVYANRAAARQFGTTPLDILGCCDSNFVSPEAAMEFRESDQHVLSSMRRVQLYESHQDESGSERHALVSKFPIPVADGDPPLVGGVAIDITERMHAEETIRGIVEGIAPTTGPDFFRALAAHLSRACHVDYAFVGRVDSADEKSIQTIAVSHRGEMIENLAYDLRGTPCEHVIRHGICYRATGVQSAFPEDPLLGELNIDGYMGTPLFSSEGKPLGLVVLMHTQPIIYSEQAMAILRVVAARAGAELEREQTQAELGRTRLEFDFLAEAFPSLVFRADDRGDFITINDGRWMRLTGRGPRTWQGQRWISAVHPDDQERVRRGWHQFVGTGESWADEFRFLRIDGSVAWVLAQAVPMRDSAGRIVDYFGACIDITHLIETKQALRLTQYSVDQAAIAIFWTDRQARIRYVNDAACVSVGYSRNELLGMSMLDLTTHAADAWDARFEEVVAKGSTWYETRHRRRDGSEFPVEMSVNYVRFCGEDFMFAFAQDITERKRAEDRLQQQSTELAHVSRLSTMGEMVATISHELAQPLSAVANYASACEAQIGKPKRDDATLAEYLDGISRQTSRAGDILRRVRDFVRNTVPKKAVCDLNSLLDDSLALMNNDFRRHDVVVSSELNGDPVRAVVDRVQLQQVVVNLLSNARDAMRNVRRGARKVTVRSKVDGKLAVIEVEDRGPGLDDNVRDRLFEPFVTTKESGMGIGLSICKTIVESHGGTISAGRGEAGGALFRVELPLAEGETVE